MKVYIVWNYDDNILAVFSTLEAAEKYREEGHAGGWLWDEDTFIHEFKVDG